MTYTQITMASDGWERHPQEAVVPLTERYKNLGLPAVLEYAKALAEAHLKEEHAAALMGTTENGKIVLIEMFYRRSTKTF